MCNLYRMSKSASEIARLFRVGGITNADFNSTLYPKGSGLVVVKDSTRVMTWGFPLPQISKKTGKPIQPKPVNNARTDKLNTNFWNTSFRDRRCLIPVSAFAEAEGERGQMTRTWFSDPDGATLAMAGVWRGSAEWGDCYSMVMTEANNDVAPVHKRMPVILSAENWASYLGGNQADALELCRPYVGQLEIERTDELWFKK